MARQSMQAGAPRRRQRLDRRWARSLGPGLVAATLAACGLGGPAYGPPAPGAGAAVQMTTNLTFQPAEVTIDAGQTVEWRNQSLFSHTVTTDPMLAQNAKLVRVAENATVFHSGEIPPGEIFRYNFTVPGTYHYICVPHEAMGMRGTVIVRPRS